MEKAGFYKTRELVKVNSQISNRKVSKHNPLLSEACLDLLNYRIEQKDLADTAVIAKDHMLYTLTHKYLAEQVEEHSKMQDLVDQLETFGEDKIALRLLDNSLK